MRTRMRIKTRMRTKKCKRKEVQLEFEVMSSKLVSEFALADELTSQIV